MPSFWRMSLPMRFTVFCGTTRILQFVVDVFADVISMFSVPFTYILLLLKHLNSPTFIAFLCMFFPSFDVSQVTVVCDIKLRGLPVFTSLCSVNFPVWL